MKKETSTKPTETQVHNALETKIRNAEAKALNWAVGYAVAGLGMHGEALRIQVLYVLNNMTHWRGEDAKQVRATLKAFTK